MELILRILLQVTMLYYYRFNYSKLLYQTPKNINTLTQQSHCYFIIILHNFYTNTHTATTIYEIHDNKYFSDISTILMSLNEELLFKCQQVQWLSETTSIMTQ